MRYLRRGWRRLISMRTALVLLFLLALAAVPGSLLPQRPLNPAKVDDYLRTHGAWGRFLDRIGMYDVFGSAWFAAISRMTRAIAATWLVARRWSIAPEQRVREAEESHPHEERVPRHTLEAAWRPHAGLEERAR